MFGIFAVWPLADSFHLPGEVFEKYLGIFAIIDRILTQ